MQHLVCEFRGILILSTWVNKTLTISTTPSEMGLGKTLRGSTSPSSSWPARPLSRSARPWWQNQQGRDPCQSAKGAQRALQPPSLASGGSRAKEKYAWGRVRLPVAGQAFLKAYA